MCFIYFFSPKKTDENVCFLDIFTVIGDEYICIYIYIKCSW